MTDNGWRDRYALTPRTNSGDMMRAYGFGAEPVYHHEHPRVAGVAHCPRQWPLDMTTLIEARPADDRYCKRCLANELNWKARRGSR